MTFKTNDSYKISFNYAQPKKYWNNDTKSWSWSLPYGGKEMQVDNLESLRAQAEKIESKSELPWIQIFNSGYRVDKKHCDWSKWTGCCYVDLDSKKYYNEVKKFDVQKLQKALYDYLIFNANYNFYCMQLSNSGTSFHFVFYFNVEKNEHNFKKCSNYSIDIIKDAFESLGEEVAQIINYKKVIDSCAISPYQGMYVTKQEILYNELGGKWFGHWDWIDDYIIKENKIVSKDKVKENLIDFKGHIYNNKNASEKYYEHILRWQIYNSLIPCFNDQKEVDEAWETKIVPYLKEGNGHTKKFYKDEPRKNNWYERYDTQYVDESYIEPFGFSFDKRFVPQKIELYKPDVVVELGKEQRLSDVELPLVTNKINHIYAGCGVGKTTMSKMLGTNLDDIDFIFNGINRVCVIVPLKSISKNSFENVKDWVCVDGDLDDSLKRTVLNNQFKNICTTWESFVIYEMHNMNFDYVIVDEIHTLYMYDYRVESVTFFKNAIKNCSAKYTIFMTGTPSYETTEFDCHKIEIRKEDISVPCEIVVYNEAYMGWIFNDIKEWTKEDNHYALIFKDTTNYKIEDDGLTYGINIDVFNKQYSETTEYILKNENVKSKVTAFSVYGQAGINLYIRDFTKEVDKYIDEAGNDVKVRIYIVNDNGLGIIQYANRVRNKYAIDKVVTFYKSSKIDTNASAVSENIDIEDAKRRVKVLASTKKEAEIFKVDNDSFIKLHYHFNKACVDWGLMSLNEPNYTNYKIIQNVLEHERQLQIIYNRLTSSYFKVKLTYLEKDVKRKRDTKMRNNQFAGQMIKFDLDMIKVDRNNNIRLETTDSFNKIVTGNLLPNLQNVLNNIYIDNDKDLEATKSEFKNLVASIVMNKGTIKKADINNLNTLYELRSNWNRFYDKVFIKIMLNEKWDSKQIAAVYMRTIYNETMQENDWHELLEETYQNICSIRSVVVANKEIFVQLDKDCPVTNIKFNNDELLTKFNTYLYNKHRTGTKEKKCTVKGIEFDSVQKAAEYFNVRRETITRWLKQEK